MTEFLNALTAELREVIECIYLDDLNERETAQRLGISRHQVRTRHNQAIAILRGEV